MQFLFDVPEPTEKDKSPKILKAFDQVQLEHLILSHCSKMKRNIVICLEKVFFNIEHQYSPANTVFDSFVERSNMLWQHCAIMASARPGLSRFLKKVEESFNIIVVTRLALEPAEVVLAKAGVLEDIFAIINIDFKTNNVSVNT